MYPDPDLLISVLPDDTRYAGTDPNPHDTLQHILVEKNATLSTLPPATVPLNYAESAGVDNVVVICCRDGCTDR